jgi:hypothetical protein
MGFASGVVTCKLGALCFKTHPNAKHKSLATNSYPYVHDVIFRLRSEIA